MIIRPVHKQQQQQQSPLLCAGGVAPPESVLQRVLIKYVGSEWQLKECLASLQTLPAPPSVVIVDDLVRLVLSVTAGSSLPSLLSLMSNAVSVFVDCTAIAVVDNSIIPSSVIAGCGRWAPLVLEIAPMPSTQLTSSQQQQQWFSLSAKGVPQATKFAFEMVLSTPSELGGFFLRAEM